MNNKEVTRQTNKKWKFCLILIYHIILCLETTFFTFGKIQTQDDFSQT